MATPVHFTIIVEGTPHQWNFAGITYEQVVTLEFPDFASHSDVNYTVTYENGPAARPKGSLVRGATVVVVDQMIFHVSESGQS
jgi:hypothetical protein